MQLLDGRLVLAASDLNNFLECAHLSHLDLEVAAGRLELEPSGTAAGDLLARKGEEHERAWLERLRAEGREVVEIADPAPLAPGDGTVAALERAAADTRAAMEAGAEVIYQAAFFDGAWRGHADFLERVDRPSALGPWSYEVADAKLARRTKPHFLIQLCFYSELLARAQGVDPDWMHVILGTRERQRFRLGEFAAYYRRIRRELAERLEAGMPGTYPDPVEHCAVCRWSGHCDERRERDDHLSLVAGVGGAGARKLARGGIHTVAELAQATPEMRPPKMGEGRFGDLRAQARLQVAQRESGELAYELLDPEPGRGFSRLPLPSPGDLFFDMEGDPFFDEGLEYLFGVAWAEDGAPRFRAFWGRDRGAEKRAFEEFMDLVMERLARFPDMHVYHYGSYEPHALKQLMGRHGTREDEVDELLRRKVLVDLLAVVCQSMRISQPSYSLKDVEAFYMRPRAESVTDAGDSIVRFEQWLDTGDATLLDEIERYNQADCRSTLLLHDWLLERRGEAEALHGAAIEWFSPEPPPEPGEEAEEIAGELAELRAGLLAAVPEDLADATGDQRTRWLMVQLLDYHRREAKPAWWAYFARQEMSEDELVADAEAIGSLRPDEDVPPTRHKRSLDYTMCFDAQEHKLGPGDGVEDPQTAAGFTLVAVDDAQGRLILRRGSQRAEEPLPRAIVPCGPYRTTEQRAALRRVGAAVLDAGIDGDGPFRAARGVLARELPRLRAREPGAPLQDLAGDGASPLDATLAAASALDRSHLFVQGPPGSGKTWTGANLIVHLLRAGKRVGVAANSHKAIHNLLREVEEVAARAPDGFRFRGLKKASTGNEESRYEPESPHGMVEDSTELADFPPADPDVRLVAGTAWLFAPEQMDGALDYLVIDEAGQVSLADALAMGTAADNLVLLGDPLQLAQVSQAIHPDGAGRSVLEHLLGPAATIPADRGIFLEQTRRMHPDVCRFVSEVVYEERLESWPECARQQIHSSGLSGTGVRWVPVEHEGNSRQSTEEAEAIAAEVERLRGGQVADADGRTRPLEEADIMVVTPYNAQVRCLRERLPAGVRVGTVDRFQGQAAQVVFFSMATSSGEEIPRNVEFLFSRNRLNVAVSRARCLAVLVASPQLLHIRCRSAGQMRLVNALCRLVEMAR